MPKTCACWVGFDCCFAGDDDSCNDNGKTDETATPDRWIFTTAQCYLHWAIIYGAVILVNPCLGCKINNETMLSQKRESFPSRKLVPCRADRPCCCITISVIFIVTEDVTHVKSGCEISLDGIKLIQKFSVSGQKCQFFIKFCIK